MRIVTENVKCQETGIGKENLVKLDGEYKKWIKEVSNRFRASQVKAASKVNIEMLKFYYYLGSEIADRQEENHYGTAFYEKVSCDLKKELPDIHSFSVTNLKYMVYFYELYKEDSNCPQTGDNLEDIIFLIPWGHHKLIMGRCRNNKKKALFFVNKTLENNWSRAVLLNFLDTDLYERQGKAVTNFAQTLPEIQSDLAQAITKDPYNFDFLTLRDKYDEKELKDALMEKVQSFLLELGTGFAYVGREVRIKVGLKEKFIDLLFYNTRLHCYVVVEVKSGEFDSSNMGQLGTYVVAVNYQIKTEYDNPTIGLVVCKGMDKIEAQYALEASSQPLGVSSYELSKLVPDEFKGSIPTIEEIEGDLNNL